MTEKTTYLITGSSRGIGLEFVRQLSASPSNVVIASCRTPDKATDLNAIAKEAKGTVHVVPLDTTSKASISAVETFVKNIVGEGALDYLLNNAAINPGEDSPFGIDEDDFIKTMTTNVFGPAKLAETLLPYLERSKRPVVMNMTTGLSSIGLDCGPKCTTYSVSKTALNMLTYKQSKEKPNIIFYVVDPGWVKTEMGGEGAFLEPEFSVSHLVKLLHTITVEQSRTLLKYDGSALPCGSSTPSPPLSSSASPTIMYKVSPVGRGNSSEESNTDQFLPSIWKGTTLPMLALVRQELDSLKILRESARAIIEETPGPQVSAIGAALETRPWILEPAQWATVAQLFTYSCIADIMDIPPDLIEDVMFMLKISIQIICERPQSKVWMKLLAEYPETATGYLLPEGRY
ncbi:hypothetical protein EUX98_g1382 [Antrodiella citrinella]|uniref:NAD(P)-binding protein n=1 Tax=Antrodiella citrinella TaxID=2447956 RepID=A0A4V3XJE2_9APHY|nr:hypothetical protein EUX98_g1382 [Antrodiella citrinella]